MIIPGVQYPHCKPWCSVKACCTVQAPFKGEALDGGDLLPVGRPPARYMTSRTRR